MRIIRLLEKIESQVYIKIKIIFSFMFHIG